MNKRRSLLPSSDDPQVNKARERARRHYAENRSEKLAYAANYRAEHKEQIAATVKEWADSHRDHLKDYRKEYWVKGQPVVQVYREGHKNEIAAYQRKYVATHGEAIKAQRRLYYQTPEGFASIQNSNHKRRRNAHAGEQTVTPEQLVIIRAAAKECFYCGLRDTPLTIDHFIAIARSGKHVLKNIRMACKPCNCHKKDRDPEEFMSSKWLLDRKT